MTVISFYTKNTIYEKEVEDLAASCRALEIDHYIEAREDLGNWEQNCCQKPLFILECLEKFNKPLLWVDADGVVLQKPSLSFEEFDLGLYYNNVRTKHVRAATVYISPTQAAKNFLKLWHQTCLEKIARREKLPFGDQAVLIALLRKKEIPLKIGKLPLEYTRIFDRDLVPMEKTVIIHFQASRTALMDPIFWKNLTGRDLKAMRMAQR